MAETSERGGMAIPLQIVKIEERAESSYRLNWRKLRIGRNFILMTSRARQQSPPRALNLSIFLPFDPDILGIKKNVRVSDPDIFGIYPINRAFFTLLFLRFSNLTGFFS